MRSLDTIIAVLACLLSLGSPGDVQHIGLTEMSSRSSQHSCLRIYLHCRAAKSRLCGRSNEQWHHFRFRALSRSMTIFDDLIDPDGTIITSIGKLHNGMRMGCKSRMPHMQHANQPAIDFDGHFLNQRDDFPRNLRQLQAPYTLAQPSQPP